MIEVLDPGAFTTVQDLGRPGFARYGVPPSGAMDALGLRAANLACGNAGDAAGLECTLVGPTLRFTADAVVALGGARFAASLDGEDVPSLEAFRVGAGQTLSVGRGIDGARCSVCVRGGLATEVVLGSRSAYVAAGIGAALRKGDRLPAFEASLDGELRVLDPGLLPPWPAPLRVMLGPQEDAFTDEARAAFLGGRYAVSTRADRTGIRLEGPALAHTAGAEIPPEGMVAGAIQVPGDGAPIILGPDRPVTGGYAKIATVISADLWLLGRLRPGDDVRFEAVGPELARAALADLETGLMSAMP